MYDPIEDDPDGEGQREDGHNPRVFASPGSALRAASKHNPRNLPCPKCGTRNVLTPADRARGYVCDSCADRTERGMDY